MAGETPQGRTDRASMEIDAPADRIYASFADPSQLMQWLPPDTMTGHALEYDFREGGRYRIALTYGDEAPTGLGKTTERTDVSTGRFVALEPGRRIVQAGEFDSDDDTFTGEMVVTWSFEPTATGTKVTITAENVPSGISREDHAAGLRSSLDNLARFMRRLS
jgi:uncharacterized protein YndB with AHSA1/START domain